MFFFDTKSFEAWIDKKGPLFFFLNSRRAIKKSAGNPIYLKRTFNDKAERRILVMYDIKSDGMKLSNDNFMRMTGEILPFK